ncbi:uncharacterized protein TRIVIDRAFT_205868 [Trichoderma virens Gv29-8]|uniref:Uncharacterized protein n=1 Tax=Hypocrea virens (strain Gv29-8 / FGSC 10586) TaxID=413071 RepID=G9N8G1_HYPVG|nr:uncharacterized protein TRIVIDRAFT_205868 [Trichoderma virens Gv29-8]EHK17269.1 hypothetical protein TRIVIDRAFT_205868 [Trichoderma virens Gv29-8]
MHQQMEIMKQSQNQEKKKHKQELENLRTEYEKNLNEQHAHWRDTSSQLQNAKAEVVELQKHIHDNEAIITKAHEAMVSSLSEGVSRALTDDVIKEELKRFYQNNLLEWCAEMSCSDIPEPEETKRKLQSEGIINSSNDYLNQPINLQFSMHLPYGRSSMILLQAVLSQTLCETFLQDAYFLAEGVDLPKVLGHDVTNGRRRFRDLEGLFYNFGKDVSIDWRIQTVKCLEKAIPLDLHFVENMAKEFVKNFHFLLKEMNDQALEDLYQLFIDFGNITLKLWKMRTAIKVHDSKNLNYQHRNPLYGLELADVSSSRNKKDASADYGTLGAYPFFKVLPIFV